MNWEWIQILWTSTPCSPQPWHDGEELHEFRCQRSCFCYVWPRWCEDQLDELTANSRSYDEIQKVPQVSRVLFPQVEQWIARTDVARHTNRQACSGNDRLPNSNKCGALFPIRRPNTCRLFRNLRTLLAVPSKGITLRERAASATFQGPSQRYTTPQDRPHTFLSKINTENKTRRKVNPPGADTTPAKR